MADTIQLAQGQRLWDVMTKQGYSNADVQKVLDANPDKKTNLLAGTYKIPDGVKPKQFSKKFDGNTDTAKLHLSEPQRKSLSERRQMSIDEKVSREPKPSCPREITEDFLHINSEGTADVIAKSTPAVAMELDKQVKFVEPRDGATPKDVESESESDRLKPYRTRLRTFNSDYR